MTTTRPASSDHAPGPGGVGTSLRSTDWLALGAALLTVVLWASAFVGIRAVAPDISPGPLTFGRMLIGFVVLGAFVVVRRQALPRGRDLVFVAGCGVLWFGIYSVALNSAERLVDAGTASMLVNVGPILIALLGWLVLREGLSPRLLAGCAVAFGGAVVIGLATSDAGSGGADATTGIILCLVAAVAYAGGVTLQKPALARVPALTVTWLACGVGALVTALFAPQLAAELGQAPIESAAWVVYLGLFPTAIAFTTWGFALARTTAGRLGATTYLVPSVAIALSWALLGEVPPALAIVGGVVCIGGVVVARSRPRPVALTEAATA
jgi:drug/metabolite transporter (DMT)-like permease